MSKKINKIVLDYNLYKIYIDIKKSEQINKWRKDKSTFNRIGCNRRKKMK